MPQAGRTSSMMQIKAFAITRFACSVFDNCNKRFMPLVPGEEFALVGNPAEQVMGDLDIRCQDLQLPIADQCLVDQAHKPRIMRLYAQ